MKLNEIRDNEGARKSRMRVGRGTSSGKGKTAGRGVKGQTSRSGVAIKGFEGGQMPLHMRLPKRGFNVPNPKKLNAVNLGRLQVAIDAGKLKKGATVSAASLVEAGVLRRQLDGVRILAKGELKDKLDFEVAGMSKAAQEAVEKLGGNVNLVAVAAAATDAKPEAAADDAAASDDA
ncbi:MAG: 50S ribosomal protein L15 [Parvibaculales bacterium]